MHTLWQDLRYAARQLARSPGFTLVAILTLALGIGATTAIFSLVNAVMVRPLPYHEPDRLVRLDETNLGRGWDSFAVSQPNFLDFREQSRSFERLAAFTPRPSILTGRDEPERVPGLAVSVDLLPVLGITPAYGRNFHPEEDAPGARARVVLLAHGLWQRRFGGDPGIVGRTIQVNDESHTVVGVLPESFQWRATELFTPLAASPAANRSDHNLSVIGRLKAGVTLAQAASDMTAIAARLAAQYPQSNDGWSARLITFYDWLIPENVRRALLVLLAAVAFVLLIACANLANLMLARATARRKEMAIRLALGAGRAALVRQVLTESVLLALVGGGLGVLVALWSIDVLRTANLANLPRLEEISLDARVLGFSLAVAVLTGILFGLVPAVHSSRATLNDALKEGGRTGDTSRSRHRTRNLLVVAEVALSLMLLIGGGLLLRSYWELQNVHPGFRSERLLTAQIFLPAGRYGEYAPFVAFYDSLMQRLRAVPGVEAASFASNIPLDGGRTAMEVYLDEREAEPDGSTPSAQWRIVGPDYFRTMGIPLLRGSDLNEPDARDPWGVVISEEMARRYWPNEDPIGKKFRPWSRTNDPITIVGVVGDVRLFGLDTDPGPVVYLSYRIATRNPMSLVLRARGDAAALAPALRDAVRSLDANLPLANVRTMEDLLDSSLSTRRFNTQLLMLFSGAALLLAAVGLFGVMAYLVAQRTREIAIRMALGSQPGDIFRLIVGRGMLLAGIGAALGLAGAFGLTRVLASLLYGVNATDPLTFVVNSVLLLGIALAACWIPARRATRVDPMTALRYE